MSSKTLQLKYYFDNIKKALEPQTMPGRLRVVRNQPSWMDLQYPRACYTLNSII